MANMPPYTFFNDVEKRLNYVLYGDTDSDFVWIPKVKVDYNNLIPIMNIANKVGKDVNARIEDHIKGNVLPKLGIDPEWNRTTFKTEIIADSILFVGTKKNYAYRLLVKEGIIIDDKPVEYTGLIAKSDMTQYTKKTITTLIEKLAFDKNIKLMDKHKYISSVQKDIANSVLNDVKELNVLHIGQPKKWSSNTKNNKDTWQNVGMRLYNTIMEDMIFKPMTSGILLPIQITDIPTFESKIKPLKNTNEYYLTEYNSTSDCNYIAFPYTFDPEKVKNKLAEYCIQINVEALLIKINGQNVTEIISLLNQYGNAISAQMRSFK